MQREQLTKDMGIVAGTSTSDDIERTNTFFLSNGNVDLLPDQVKKVEAETDESETSSEADGKIDESSDAEMGGKRGLMMGGPQMGSPRPMIGSGPHIMGNPQMMQMIHQEGGQLGAKVSLRAPLAVKQTTMNSGQTIPLSTIAP